MSRTSTLKEKFRSTIWQQDDLRWLESTNICLENPIYSMSEKHHRRKIMSTYWLIEHDELKLRSLPLFLPPMIAIFLGLFYWDSLPNINTNYSIFVGIWRQRGFPFLSNGFYRYKTLNGTRVLSVVYVFPNFGNNRRYIPSNKLPFKMKEADLCIDICLFLFI